MPGAGLRSDPMKPARFEYRDPATLEEALALLRQHGDEAKLLAGGQSLIPMLNMRLARPPVLIDLNRVTELAYVREENGYLAIGAMTRHADVERSELVARRQPLLAEAMHHVGHVQIRNRGTIGGSLVHADPSAELPAVMAALDAVFVAASPDGVRAIPAADFFLMYFTTCLRPDEILTEIRVPVLPPRTGWAFLELARRSGDFALAGVACTVTLSAGGTIAQARLGLTGVGMTPVRALSAEALLVGQTPAAFAAAAQEVAANIMPDDDIHATAEYRQELAGVLVQRALTLAYERGADQCAALP
ncbi:MAG TPA: xanthine dehydrogenase family protein subunit M [Symbiobacteriaceae bacterium]|nr:xanthine dehydrogenase family protein subunit M [Symbiobacteriaceae bacterium]